VTPRPRFARARYLRAVPTPTRRARPPILALALAAATACGTGREPNAGTPAPPDTTRAPAPAPAPAPVLPPAVAAAPAAAAPPRHQGALTARERFVRDSIARAAFVRDSLARDVFVRDSLAREAFVTDSLRLAAARRDSLARAEFVRDSLRQDSLARAGRAPREDYAAVVAARAAKDSAAIEARADSLYGPDGAMPRIEGDPNISRPTVALSFQYVSQVHDMYSQITASYGRPFWDGGSWEIDVPVQHWDSVGGAPKSVTGLANITLTVNKRISSRDAAWRQIASFALQPQTGLVDKSIGNDQWIATAQYAISRWFADDRFHFRSITYYQYGWWVDQTNGTKQKNQLVPRLVFTGRVTPKIDLTADLRPRIDFTRDLFYSTLMFMGSTPVAQVYGLQFGYEFPLSETAKQKVEKEKFVLTLSRTF